MKHLKLFEEFNKTILYKMKPGKNFLRPPFEDIMIETNSKGISIIKSVSMYCQSKDELDVLIYELEKIKMTNPYDDYDTLIGEEIIVTWGLLEDKITGDRKLSYLLAEAEVSEAENPLNFEDYFEPLEKYKGHHTGKQYGI